MKWKLNTIFICFMGRILLDPSTSSSSSFLTSSFLIQMLIWIRGFWRVESSVFLITWGIFFGLWELDLQLLPSSPSLTLSWASSYVHSSKSPLKVITSFWHTFLKWMNPMILEGHSRWLSQLLHSPLLLLLLQVVKYDCMVSAFWIFAFFKCFLKVIFWFMFFP